jgi:hypothetical protein
VNYAASKLQGSPKKPGLPSLKTAAVAQVCLPTCTIFLAALMHASTCCCLLCCTNVQLCSNLAIRPAEGGSKDMSLQLGRLISSVILLRDVLRIVPFMADSMAWVDSTLLKVRLAVHQGCHIELAVH